MLKFILPLIGSLLYRWRGSSLWTPPRPVVQIFIALPFGLLLHDRLLAVAVIGLTAIALCIGHGQYQSMGRPDVTKDKSSVDFLINWLFKSDPASFLHCFAGMALTGVLVTLPAGIALQNPVLAASGALKAVAYTIGARGPKYQAFGDTSEFLTGAVFWGFAAYYL